MLKQQLTQDMDEHVGFENQKIECYMALEAMLCIPREELESTIEKQYPEWLRSLTKEGEQGEDPSI